MPDAMGYSLDNPPVGYVFVGVVFPAMSFWGKTLSWRDDFDDTVILNPDHLIVPLCPTGSTCYLYERKDSERMRL
jgi:hypothetical protein